ncbi:MAG: malto-oligosyltrehalose synthase [Myxococcota bacterium]
MSAESTAVDTVAAQLLEEARLEAAHARTPLSTYRVQLHHRFTFEDAGQVVPYLAQLGVSDLYASPYLKAMPGSLHGYDVLDHRVLNPEIGTEEEHARFCAALADAGLGQLLDCVPNHMGIEGDNALWLDVLENGQASVFAHVFDIDWQPVKAELAGKVLLPILGDPYGVVLERGELKLSVDFQKGAFFVNYFDHRLPVAPCAYAQVLRHRLDELVSRVGEGDAHLVELQSILTALDHLPPHTEAKRPKVLERNREKEVIKRRLADLLSRSEALRAFVQRNVGELNGRVNDPHSFDLLDRLLEAGCYRLAHWRTAGEEINYRRFFDINSLAAIRVEDPEVFDLAHARIFEWLGEGKVTGLRVDHPDGLFDPTAYFLDLQERFVLTRAQRRFGIDRPQWPEVEMAVRAGFRAEVHARLDSPLRRALYVVVEKIQGGRERIPDEWAIAGTTGYRFANMVGGVLVDRAGESALSEVYERFTQRRLDFRALLYEKKRLVLTASMASELNVLAHELNRISELNRRTRDFTLNALRRTLLELIALFPVYRTYVDDWHPEVDEHDVRYVSWTIARAIEKDPTTNVSIFRFLEDILLRRYPEHISPAERKVMLRFAMKLQQLTGPVMAKGLEDTAFYVYNRLISLNEVGGEPDRFGTTLATFHLRNQERAASFPGSLLPTSTHDTKRSEDVRARLHVLSELPEEWEAAVKELAALSAPYRTWLGEAYAPSPNDQYLFFQTVVGAYPMGPRVLGHELAELRRRLRDYMLKAVREAKENTSWVNPNVAYEDATTRFVEACLTDEREGGFLHAAYRMKRRLERPGQLNSLSQTLLKLASPGVTDVYQGCELWDLSLVDPDNRRPVDFTLRARFLTLNDARAREDRAALCRELAKDMTDGRAKLYLLAEGLRLRRGLSELFRQGAYQPLDVQGEGAAHAVALARHHGDQWVVAVAPRLMARVRSVSQLAGTEVVLPSALGEIPLNDALTGAVKRARKRQEAYVLDLEELWADFPVALLFKGGE